MEDDVFDDLVRGSSGHIGAHPPITGKIQTRIKINFVLLKGDCHLFYSSRLLPVDENLSFYMFYNNDIL
jgi:hypothetical protein